MANNTIPKPFNLLRWFSIASLLALLPIAGITGLILSHFITEETLQRDATLTAQFINNCIDIEGSHLGLGPNVTFAELLNENVDPEPHGVSRQAIADARRDVHEHLRTLSDVLLASVFTRDGRIIWSSNPSLIGTISPENDELEEAFSSHILVSKQHAGNKSERSEQRFVVQPKEFFIENYFPLHDAKGEVTLVVEVYKEPRNLIATIKKGQLLVWGTTLGAGLMVYLGLFSIIRRGSSLLEQQQKRLVETDSLVFVGEMSTALAHSLRNPLASVRSSAELALGTEDLSVRKNAQDIINQVDFLSKWVRELLTYSRPVTAEPEVVDLVLVLANVLDSFAAPFEKLGIKVNWSRDETYRPRIQGNTSLMTQALHSIISNAVEAMPRGGELRIGLANSKETQRVELTIADTGSGMSKQRLELAFKPFHTTKRNGLGVGLSMVKRIMDRFGGEVRLASRENEGTQVQLEFSMA